MLHFIQEGKSQRKEERKCWTSYLRRGENKEEINWTEKQIKRKIKINRGRSAGRGTDFIHDDIHLYLQPMVKVEADVWTRAKSLLPSWRWRWPRWRRRWAAGVSRPESDRCSRTPRRCPVWPRSGCPVASPETPSGSAIGKQEMTSSIWVIMWGTVQKQFFLFYLLKNCLIYTTSNNNYSLLWIIESVCCFLKCNWVKCVWARVART